MAVEISDRRVRKTRQLLKEALILLISEKSFESVTIQEILDRANVGRSTFYMHYGNKFDLLHSCFEDFNAFFEQYDTDPLSPVVHPGIGGKTDFLLDMFRFVGRNHRLVKALLANDNGALLNPPVHEYVFRHVADFIKREVPMKKATPIETDMLTNYMAHALIGTLVWWVNKDMPFTAEEITRYFKRFAHDDINKAFI